MKATLDWLKESSAYFTPSDGQVGQAYLQNYTASFRLMGEGPPLVLVPGLAGGLDLLGPLARELAKHYRVISYQLRGEEDCFALRQQFGMRELVADLAEFMEWMHLETPAIMGVSFGGALALEFAARHPRQISALVVQGAGSRFENGLLQEVASLVLSQYPLPADNPFVNQFFNLLFGSRQKAGPLFDFVTRQCWQTDQSVMAHRFRLVEHFDFRPRMEQIVAPTLLLGGDRDMLVSKGSMEALREGIPHNRSVSLPGCGHLAFLTQPERLAREVDGFLSELEGVGLDCGGSAV